MKTKTITIKTPNNTHIRDKHIKSRISSIDRTADREGIYMSDPLHRMVCHPQRVLLRMFLSYKLSVFFQSHPVCPLALLIFPADGCRAVVESCVQHVYDGLLCSNERKAKRSEETFPTKAKKRTNQIDAYRTDPTPTRNDTHTHTHTYTPRACIYGIIHHLCHQLLFHRLRLLLLLVFLFSSLLFHSASTRPHSDSRVETNKDNTFNGTFEVNLPLLVILSSRIVSSLFVNGLCCECR